MSMPNMTPSSSLSRAVDLFLTFIGILPAALPSSAQTYVYNHASFATGGGADGVVTADFKYDGQADLAVSNHYDNTLSVLLGARGGAFVGEARYAAGSSPTHLITLRSWARRARPKRSPSPTRAIRR